MSFTELMARIEAARTTDVVVQGVAFVLRLPTAHRWRVLLEAQRNAAGVLQEAQAFRAILEEAIVEWRGLEVRHLDPHAELDARVSVVFSPEARAALLDHRQDIADELTVALAAKVAERRRALEDAAKNS